MTGLLTTSTAACWSLDKQISAWRAVAEAMGPERRRPALTVEAIMAVRREFPLPTEPVPAPTAC
jgi:hypothetical protein